MKNIQVIDKADNCTYSIYSVSDELFEVVFPEQGQDIEFNSNLLDRLSEEKLIELNKKLWETKLPKPEVQGIHGTLFYDLDLKKKFYPTKKESEMVVVL